MICYRCPMADRGRDEHTEMRYPTRVSVSAQPSSYRSCPPHRAIAPYFSAAANRRDRALTSKLLDYEHQSSCATIGSQTGSSNLSTTSSTTAAMIGTSSSTNPGGSCQSASEIGPMRHYHRVLVYTKSRRHKSIVVEGTASTP